MDSIKEKLNLSLISILLGISLLFIVYLIVLHSFGFNLTPEAYAEIISALATLLVVVVTLGLRLMDDELKRYETYAKPRIDNLKAMIDNMKKDLQSLGVYNTPNWIQSSQKSLSDLEKYGRFFSATLYPQKSLEKTKKLIVEIENFMKNTKEIESYWTAGRSDLFLNLVILGRNKENEGLSGLFKEAKKKADELTKEKPEILNQIRTQREKLLLEIEKIIEELDDFIEIN